MAGLDVNVASATRHQTGYRGIFKSRRVLGLCLYASLGGILYGYNQGVFSNVQVMAEFEHRYASTMNDPISKGMLTAILELGAFLAAMVAGPISDRYSRKYSISAWCIVFMLGVALQVGANNNVGYIYAGRWFAGMGVGALSTLVPMFNAELAPPGIRGTLVALQQLSICFGILVAYWVAYGTNFIGGTKYPGQSTAAWRIPLALQLVPAIALCAGIPFVPFSPRWLMLRDREEECLQVLCHLRDLPESDPEIQYEFGTLKAEHMAQKEAAVERYGVAHRSFKIELLEYCRLLSTPSLLKRVGLGAAAQGIGQWTGINAIIYYAPTVFAQLGLQGGTIGLLATGIVGVVQFFATIPGVLFVDNTGRRPLFMWGLGNMIISHAGVAAIVAVYGGHFDQHKAAGNGAVFLIYWYVAAYAFAYGPVGWVVVAETCPLDQRARGIGIASGTNWIMNFVVAWISPIMIERLGYKTFIVFMVCCIVGLLWVIFILPELKGLSLEEIDKLFDDKAGEHERLRHQRIARDIGLEKLEHDLRHQENATRDV